MFLPQSTNELDEQFEENLDSLSSLLPSAEILPTLGPSGKLNDVAAFSRQISLLFEAETQHLPHAQHPASGLGARLPLPPITKPPSNLEALADDCTLEVIPEP
jgi:hypothetical protein